MSGWVETTMPQADSARQTREITQPDKTFQLAVGRLLIIGRDNPPTLEPPPQMPMPLHILKAELQSAFPDAEIEIQDLAGDGDHYKAIIVAREFTGLSRVKQHKLVYEALKGKVGGELHALALETRPPS